MGLLMGLLMDLLMGLLMDLLMGSTGLSLAQSGVHKGYRLS